MDNAFKREVVEFRQPFWGLTLGCLERHHISTHELMIEKVIVDCTHRRFVFQRYFGGDGEKVRSWIDGIFADAKVYDRDYQKEELFPIIWTWAKRHLITRQLRFSNKVCYYDPTSTIVPLGFTLPFKVNEGLRVNIVELWELLESWEIKYEGRDLPEIPSDYHGKLKWLEAECKHTAKTVLRSL